MSAIFIWISTAYHSPVGTCLTITILVVACTRLCAYTDTISDFDTGRYVFADSDGFANDLMTYAHWIIGGAPTRS